MHLSIIYFYFPLPCCDSVKTSSLSKSTLCGTGSPRTVEGKRGFCSGLFMFSACPHEDLGEIRKFKCFAIGLHFKEARM